MSRADQYREMYDEMFKDLHSEDLIRSLRELVEDMILTIEQLETDYYPYLTENLQQGNIKITVSDELRTALIEAGHISPQ